MIDDKELAAKLSKLSSSAVKYNESEFSEQQERALRYYNGDAMPGDDEEGQERRSKVVSRDVAEIVDWSLPELVAMFVGSDTAVEFTANSQETEEQAKQVTEAVNHIFFEECDGFTVVHDQIKDGLLQKAGIVRVWYGKSGEATRQTIENISDEAVMGYAADEAIEILSEEQNSDGTFNIRVETIEEAKVNVDCIAPENFLISEGAIDEDTAPYIGARTRKTRSELQSEGYSKEQLVALSDDSNSSEFESLDRDEDILNNSNGDNGPDDAAKTFWVYDEFARIDIDEDGESELLRVVRVGNTILHKEEVHEQEFVVFSPKRMPHRVLGGSLADDVLDIQEVKTALYRGTMDNVALVVDPQHYVNMEQATEDTINDLLDWGPGGLVRGRGEKAVDPLTVPNISPAILSVIEYVDSAREQRTGVSRYNQGLDSESLNKTATGVQTIMEAGKQRRDLIARLYAECLRKIFQKAFRMLVRHQDKERMMRIHGEWTPIEPRTWNIGLKARPAVGLGTGDRSAKRDNTMLMLNTQMQVMPLGMANAENIYNTLEKFSATLDLGEVERFFTPAEAPPEQGPDPAMEKVQADIQVKQAELDLKAQETQMKAQAAEALAAQKMAFEEMKAELNAQLEREKLQSQSELKMMEMRIQEALKIREIDMTGETNENIRQPVDS